MNILDYINELIETLHKFAACGCVFAGLTKVNAKYTDWQTGERAVIPAIKMCVLRRD